MNQDELDGFGQVMDQCDLLISLIDIVKDGDEKTNSYSVNERLQNVSEQCGRVIASIDYFRKNILLKQ